MKKALVLILALVISLFAAIGLTACNDVEFEVKFIVDGEVYDTITTAGNEMVKIPENPTKDGYTFDGWYLDEGVWERPFTANSLLDAPLSSDMNVYAHWLTVTEPAPDDNTQGGNNGGSTTPDDNTQGGNNGGTTTPDDNTQGGTTTPDTHVHSLDHTERVEAGCTTDGNIEYWHCSGCGKNYSDANAENEVSSVVIPAGHTLTHHARVEAGCTTDGNIEYWHCSGCGKNYSDANAENEVSSVVITSAGHALTHHNRVEAGCEAGNIEYWHCSGCDKNYSDANAKTEVSSVVITPAGHAASASSTVCTRCGLFSFDGLVFTLLSDNTYAVTDYTGSAASVVIPATYENALVTSIGDEAFYDCTSLTSITIPNSVTSIGHNAFSGCTSLTSVYITDLEKWCEMFFGTTYDDLSSISGDRDNPLYYAGNLYLNDILITDLVVPDGVESISDYAFLNCTSLTSITIPNSVTSIGSFAFDGCKSLTSVVIPNSVESIGSWAFDGCNSLTINCEAASKPRDWSSTWNDSNRPVNWGYNNIKTNADYDYVIHNDKAILTKYKGTATNIVIPTTIDGYEVIEFASIYEGKNIVSIIIPEIFTNISPYAFNYCTSLESITIPNSVTSIGHYAFSGCTSLANITIPNSVESIGFRAFSGCTSLANITIPNSVESIGFRAFSGCTSIKNIFVDEDNKFYKHIDGNLYTKDCKILIQYAVGKSATGFAIPEGIESIDYYAFYNCKSLASVTIPNGVTFIGDNAFSECIKLVEVINYSSLNITKGGTDHGYIGFYAKEIHNGTSKIINDDGYLFYTYDGIAYLLGYSGVNTEITLPANYNGDDYVIYDYAFYNCTNLTSVTIPSGVTSIGDCAFCECTGLISVTIPNSVTSIGYSVFGYCDSLTNVIIGDGVTSIDSDAFFNCISLTNVIIGKNVTSIGFMAFSGCESLTSITIPSGVTSIGDYAFCECTGLISVTIPNSVTSIGNYAFHDCIYLTSVYITDIAKWCGISFGNFSANPLYYAGNLYLDDIIVTNLVIPDGVESIGVFAFLGCTSIRSVNIPNSVTSIGWSAFADCVRLASVTIPNSVTSIDSYAFSSCTSLTISCEVASQPTGWNSYWNQSNCPVNWGVKVGE